MQLPHARVSTGCTGGHGREPARVPQSTRCNTQAQKRSGTGARGAVDNPAGS